MPFGAFGFFRKLAGVLFVLALLAGFFLFRLILNVERRRDDLSPEWNLVFNVVDSSAIPMLCVFFFIYEFCFKRTSRGRLRLNSFIVLAVFAAFAYMNLGAYKDAWNGLVLGQRTYVTGQVTKVDWVYHNRRNPVDGYVSIDNKEYTTNIRFFKNRLLQPGDGAEFIIAPSSNKIIGIK